jgi:arsenate reductase (thioredoxin)
MITEASDPVEPTQHHTETSMPQVPAGVKTSLVLYLLSLSKETISPSRLKVLQSIVQSATHPDFKGFLFVCTHNSRRSQIAQVWAAFLSDLFQLDLTHFSAGTEATVCSMEMLKALKRAGFNVFKDEESQHRCQIGWRGEESPMAIYSKTINDISLKHAGLVAIMVCDDAQEQCPVVPHALDRFALTFVDPGTSDDTEMSASAYDLACRMIGNELLYLFSKVQELKKA